MWVIRPRSIIGRNDSATTRARRGAGPIAHDVPPGAVRGEGRYCARSR
jgi:hypothetical protein